MPTDEFTNFRPILNLKFLSKAIEKIVAQQLVDHLELNNLYQPLQSAYKKYHSVETALIKVHNDILRSIDENRAVFLILLDLSAAFDTVNHGILLKRLETVFGFEVQYF